MGIAHPVSRELAGEPSWHRTVRVSAVPTAWRCAEAFEWEATHRQPSRHFSPSMTRLRRLRPPRLLESARDADRAKSRAAWKR